MTTFSLLIPSGGFARDKGQLEEVDDPVLHGKIGNECNDFHLTAALGTGERVNFINLADHLGRSPGREAPELVLYNPERKSRQARRTASRIYR
jgi:hypothetical protein